MGKGPAWSEEDVAQLAADLDAGLGYKKIANIRGWPRRVDACYAAGGSHFEHSLRSAKAGMRGDASEPADAESECEVLDAEFVDAAEADESDFEVPDAFEEGEEVDGGSEPGADEAHCAVPETHDCM